MNIYQLFQERTRAKGPFLLSPSLETLFDYGDMDLISDQYAGKLAALGVSPGDRVIVQVHKSPQNLFLYFACLRAGAIYLPLNTAYLDEELSFFVDDAQPSVIVCDPSRESFFGTLPGSHRIETLDSTGTGSFVTHLPDPGFGIIPREENDIAVILYTSGTTGRPKGAMISHGNLRANGLALLEAWDWQPDDVMLHALPIFHIHGLFVATHLPVLNGTPIIFLPGYTPDVVAGLLPHATVYMGVPTNYTRLLSAGFTGQGILSPYATVYFRVSAAA